jgi:hypothetical protein
VDLRTHYSVVRHANSPAFALLRATAVFRARAADGTLLAGLLGIGIATDLSLGVTSKLDDNSVAVSADTVVEVRNILRCASLDDVDVCCWPPTLVVDGE